MAKTTKEKRLPHSQKVASFSSDKGLSNSNLVLGTNKIEYRAS